MPTCFVVGCHSGSGREVEKYQLVSFPKCDELKQKWIDSINRKNVEPNNRSIVCLKHFRKCDFVPADENKVIYFGVLTTLWVIITVHSRFKKARFKKESRFKKD